MASTNSNPDSPPGLQVLSLGLPKTGTASMAAALTILGYPTIHGITSTDDDAFWPRFERAVDAVYPKPSSPTPAPLKRADWDHLWGPTALAATDLAAFFAPQLITAYPTAKVILAERPLASWQASLDRAVLRPLWSPVFAIQTTVIEPLTGLRGGTVVKRALQGLFGAETADGIRANAESVYEKHYAMVKSRVPAERLLVYRLGEGWGPLCEFLGKPVPEGEFPRVHETEAALRHTMGKIKRDAWRAVKGAAGWALKWGAVVGFGFVAWRMMTKAGGV